MFCSLSPLFGVRWALFVAGLEGLLRGGGGLLGAVFRRSGYGCSVCLVVSGGDSTARDREATAASGMFWPRYWTEVLESYCVNKGSVWSFVK